MVSDSEQQDVYPYCLIGGMPSKTSGCEVCGVRYGIDCPYPAWRKLVKAKTREAARPFFEAYRAALKEARAC